MRRTFRRTLAEGPEQILGSLGVNTSFSRFNCPKGGGHGSDDIYLTIDCATTYIKNSHCNPLDNEDAGNYRMCFNIRTGKICKFPQKSIIRPIDLDITYNFSY